MPNEELQASLQKITGCLLAVETLINEKAQLMAKLDERAEKWAGNDAFFKERKQTFALMHSIALELASDLARQSQSEFIRLKQRAN